MEHIEVNKKLYLEKNKQYGEGSPENLWRRKESQIRRFDKFIDLMDFDNKIILDVGCGYGDFYNYLISKNIHPKNYIGCDLMPEHCKVARERLPKFCKVFEGDFLQQELPEVDISILSGTLNAEFDDWEKISTAIIERMWTISKEAISFNMQSIHGLEGDYKKKVLEFRNIDPQFWISFANHRTCKYGLYHDYMHYDYTVCMWKANIGWQEK